MKALPDHLDKEENPYGEGVLRVSEISGSFKPHVEGLLMWAGLNGIGYKGIRNRACLVGTAVHSFAEAALSGDPKVGVSAVKQFQALEPDEQEQCVNAQNAFKDWLSDHEVEPLHLEIRMNNFSGLFTDDSKDVPKIGGTCDFIGRVNGKLCIIDWKSSRYLNRSYGIQLAGYKYLWELNHPMHEEKVEGYYGLRLDKAHGFYDEYDFTPWIQEAEYRFLTLAKLLGKWDAFTTLDY